MSKAHPLWRSLDAVTGDLIVGVLTAHDIRSVCVPHGFDGVTIGHTPRDVYVVVPEGSEERARACLVAAWGERAVRELDAR
jgi:hypothetical protein